LHSLTKKVYGSTIVPSDPSSQHAGILNDDAEEPGTELVSLLTQGPGWLSYLTSTDEDPDLNIVAGRTTSNVRNHSALSSVSRADKTSHVLLSLLYSVTNNLLLESQASKVFDVISRGINRKFFEALIADVSPTTKSIARTFLPAAIQCADALMVKSLLATGINPNFDVGLNSRCSLFVNAIRRGNAEIVQHFLDRGANANVSRSDSQYTPLEAAASIGRTDVLRLLLQAGAGLNVAEPNHGSSALCFAAKYGELELVQLLVDAGADANGSMRPHLSAGYYNTRSTPLCYAARRADVAMVEYLISCGADVNVLGAAACSGDTGMIQLLLDRGANNVVESLYFAGYCDHKHVLHFLVSLEIDTHRTLHNQFGMEALVAAARCNYVELLKWLLDPDGVVSVTPTSLTTALGAVVQKGHLSVAQILVERGADINARVFDSPLNHTMLQAAVQWRHQHLVEFLLNSGADVNAPRHPDYRMTIAIAIDQQEPEIVQLLLASGADMNLHGPQAVVEAIHKGSPELLRVVMDAWMLTGDLDTDSITDPCDESSLEIAARCANVELTRILLDYNVAKADDVSWALLAAVQCGNLEVVRLHLASGAYVGYGQDEGCWDSDEGGRFRYPNTALDNAAEGGNMEILNILLQHPSTAEERTRALQVAAMHNELDVVTALLDHGVDVNAAPLSGFSELYEHDPRTVLQAAAATGNLKLVRCLLDAGATVESIVPSLRESHTAFQLAAMAGSISVVVALIEWGADVRAPAMNEWGCTAIEGAAEKGRLDIVQLLIDMGAEVTGSRAVRYARRSGHDVVVALLLSNGFEDDSDKSKQNGVYT
jgi:ankyrin repeat protein